MAKLIGIVGAGAKAAAIVARATILRDLGAQGVPTIMVFEEDHIGAAWSGGGRFSSGFLTLCTPGEKDVGFPYAERVRRGTVKYPVSPALFARFSWTAYLVATGDMSDWVDRGRDHPSHQKWAKYLAWVFESAAQSVTYAKVTKLRPVGNQWAILFDENGTQKTVLVDGVVLTGTGQARIVPTAPNAPKDRILNAETFWPARNSVLTLKEGTVAVAGDGGSAGTIVAWLAEHFAENSQVFVQSINPIGTLFPRGDGHAERRWFSDPSDWSYLSLEDRRKLLDRTEAGVVSMRIKSLIDRASNVGYVRGKAVEAEWDGSEIKIQIEYNGSNQPALMADYLVSAIGFDSWSLLNLVDDPSIATLRAPGSKDQRRQVEADMLADLTLSAISGVPPGLHIPALAGLARGPGMGNLGCLGLMAAAVLKRYAK